MVKRVVIWIAVTEYINSKKYRNWNILIHIFADNPTFNFKFIEPDIWWGTSIVIANCLQCLFPHSSYFGNVNEAAHQAQLLRKKENIYYVNY